MFTGKHPFPDFSQMQAIFKIGTNTTPEIPSWATSEGKNFLRKAFELDYQYRPSALELLQHPWLDAHII
ncbi:Ste11p [Saccharomyces cerevisiae CEN.PK113-7D]|nr:Ste11p [Saccharomyces cerevisiae CEN.PK113-7D]